MNNLCELHMVTQEQWVLGLPRVAMHNSIIVRITNIYMYIAICRMFNACAEALT